MKHRWLFIVLLVLAGALVLGDQPAKAQSPFTFCVSAAPLQDGDTTITVEVTNHSQGAVSYTRIGTGALERVSPVNSSRYQSIEERSYLVEWTKNPGFKFNTQSGGESYKDGASNTFKVTVRNFPTIGVAHLDLEGHAGKIYSAIKDVPVSYGVRYCPPDPLLP